MQRINVNDTDYHIIDNAVKDTHIEQQKDLISEGEWRETTRI